FLSVVGSDEPSKVLRQELRARGVDDSCLLVDSERTTVHKIRILANGQYLVRYDEGDSRPLSRETRRRFLERFRELFAGHDTVVISDYHSGIVGPSLIETLSALNSHGAKRVLLDSKRLLAFRRCPLSVVKPNHYEAAASLGWRPERADNHLHELGAQLMRRLLTEWVIITLGEEGSVVFGRDGSHYRVLPRRVPNPQPVGAGDTYIAALSLALDAGSDIHVAAEIAAEAAAVSASRAGTACVLQQELLQRLSQRGDPLADATDLREQVERYRREGKRIVFTNGCFDILHSGHVAFLQQARALGDVLIVGVNSDASVRRLKGPTRPINSHADRVTVLAALEAVDHVVLFEEDTPERLISELRPDVHVKGSDYSIESLPEAAIVQSYGGRVVILPLVEGKSTTAIVRKIARLSRALPVPASERGQGEITPIEALPLSPSAQVC
ncbi:MAG: D-glycero-beta-D-manno-heptose 1-phosphate adenylyltransferase, partial [Anaerolineae bacterium]|nr:D-glycero-beta-D-manno-heptose 1-phosphate adenylyltransferase [Anaerolineae bacterium]